MNKNKIIDHLFKKLLLKKFESKDIKLLLFSYVNFYSFENFIYYLFQLSQTNSDSLGHKMCASVNSYLSYLVEIYHIEGYDVKNLVKNQIYSDVEIEAISHGVQVLTLRNNEVDIYKNIIFITTPLILNNNFYVFVDNEFYGLCQSIKHTNYFFKDKQIIATMLVDVEQEQDYQWTEINNFIITKYWDSLNQLKSNLVYLLNKHKINDHNVYDNLYNAVNHFTCFNSFFNYLMWVENPLLLRDFIDLYGSYLYQYQFSIEQLLDDISTVSWYELALLTNGYDIFLGDHITVTCDNEIYCIVDQWELNEQGMFILPLFTYTDNLYFDYALNKLIMQTCNSHQRIHFFERKKNETFIYKGAFKCKGLQFAEIDENRQVAFKLMKTIPAVNQVMKKSISNEYENVFYRKLHQQPYFASFSKQTTPFDVETFTIQEDYMNSLIYKFNWVINRFITTQDYNYAFAFQKFDNQILLNISYIQQHKLIKAFEDHILSNWVIAKELYKKNPDNNLINLGYFRNNTPIAEQVQLLKKYL